MPGPVTRAAFGYLAAVVSVLTFHQGMWAVLWAWGLMPLAPYPTFPVGAIHYPLIVSLCVWGGVYGALFGLVLPRLGRPLWPWGIGLGLLATLVAWFVVSPLKGQPVADGFDLRAMALPLVINAMFGLGVALILPAMLRYGARGARS